MQISDYAMRETGADIRYREGYMVPARLVRAFGV
jgi:hypothetical protein